MRAREAKDFLVKQIKEQAGLEAVSLSEPQIQMLYFTESGGPSEKMQKSADEFDQSYDTKTYEKKVRSLMKHAYKRLQREKARRLGRIGIERFAA
jgi:hypothetical protein